MAKQPMDVWIRNAMTDEDKDGALTMLALRHMVNGIPGKVLHAVTFGKAGKSYQPDQLARTFIGIADTYAADQPGFQMYQLEAIYNDRPDPQAYLPFRRNGAIDETATTEPPDEKGMRSQMMRWNDNVLSLTFQRNRIQDETMLRMLETQNRMIEMLGGRLHEVTHENVEAFNVVRSMLEERVLNQHEYRMKELEAENRGKLQVKIAGMVPPLVNQLTGREVFPQVAEDTAILEMVAESLDPDKLPGLLTALNLDDKPELVSMLMSRFSKAVEKKQQEKQNRMLAQRAGQNHPSPEDDAAGD